MAQLFSRIKAFFITLWTKLAFSYRGRDVLYFSMEKINEAVARHMEMLYALRAERSWQHYREIVLLAKNIAILQMNRSLLSNSKQADYHFHRGRLASFDELLKYVDTSLESLRTEEKQAAPSQVQNEKKIIRSKRFSNSAGAAM